MKTYSNKELADVLKKISAAYLILGENRFKIMAYDKAAENIEHLTRNVIDIWRDGAIDTIPGIGPSIAQNLDELFRTGNSTHFDDVLKKIPESVFPLLLVPGLGPKKAYRLVTEFSLQSAATAIEDLEKIANENKIAQLEGFGTKSQTVILDGIQSYKKGQIKENRITIADATDIATELLGYLQSHPDVKRVDVLGSLRRQLATIGDIDISVITDNPEGVVKHFVQFPHERIIDQGLKGATLLLHNGRQIDLRVQDAASYGAMLQYFTGSKQHNIQLRSIALEKGLSLSEHGIKDTKTGKLTEYSDEKKFYHAIGLDWIPPELREDRGEIAAAENHSLPDLIEAGDIRGDLHMHTNYTFPTSHDLGHSHVHDHLSKAFQRGYHYIGIADHNPKISDLTSTQIAKIMEDRYVWYQQQHREWEQHASVQLFVLCEVDILVDGTLALPLEAFEFVDGVIVSLHSSFRQSREDMTKRIIKALTAHPKVRIFGHPTGRLLLQREGVDADWNEVMKVAKERNIALEINAYPDRLDLPDVLVRDAVEQGVRFSIDTDAHSVVHMDLIPYGISVARRGWVEKGHVVNALPLQQFSLWLRNQ